MKRQTKPFTVTVKKKKRGGNDSLWGDTPAMAEMMAKAADEPEVETAAGEDDAASAARSRRSPSPANERRPRILDTVKPAPALEEPEQEELAREEADEEEPPKRPRGRPRGRSTTPRPAGGKAIAEAIRAEEPESEVEPEAENAVFTTASGPEATAAVALRTRARPRNFRAGERWKRHLPRWKR